MSMYKRYFDKTNCMYFMIEDEKLFDKYMKNLEKVSNIIKKMKFNGELMYNKIYLKPKKSTQKKASSVLMYQ